MANISVSELQGILNKAGIQSNFDPRDVAEVQAEEKISEIIKKETDPAVAEAKQNYLGQIKKIADMDKKLAGVYSDENSKLFIEHPLQRERLLAGATNVGNLAAEALRGVVENTEKIGTDLVKQAQSLYNRLLERRKGRETLGSQLAVVNKYLKMAMGEEDEYKIIPEGDEYKILPDEPAENRLSGVDRITIPAA